MFCPFLSVSFLLVSYFIFYKIFFVFLCLTLIIFVFCLFIFLHFFSLFLPSSRSLVFLEDKEKENDVSGGRFLRFSFCCTLEQLLGSLLPPSELECAALAWFTSEEKQRWRRTDDVCSVLQRKNSTTLFSRSLSLADYRKYQTCFDLIFEIGEAPTQSAAFRFFSKDYRHRLTSSRKRPPGCREHQIGSDVGFIIL